MYRTPFQRRAGRYAAATAGILVASLALAACGSSGTTAPEKTEASAAVDPDGIIEAGI